MWARGTGATAVVGCVEGFVGFVGFVGPVRGATDTAVGGKLWELNVDSISVKSINVEVETLSKGRMGEASCEFNWSKWELE